MAKHLYQIADELAQLEDEAALGDTFTRIHVAHQLRSPNLISKQGIIDIIRIAKRRVKKADDLHSYDVARRVRVWAREAIGSHSRGAHAYLRRADIVGVKSFVEDEGFLEGSCR